MFRQTNTRDINIGDRIDLDNRAVIVTDNQPDGVSVMWFDDRGQGPHHATLPHADLHRTRYIDERQTDRSWWDDKAIVEGKTGEI